MRSHMSLGPKDIGGREQELIGFLCCKATTFFGSDRGIVFGWDKAEFMQGMIVTTFLP